jgi:putative transposase
MLPEKKTGRPLKHSLREMLNAIFYIVRTGCSWRNLPKDFPDWQAVYARFKRWKVKGVYDKIYEELTKMLRGKNEAQVGIADSQSVKITDRGGEHGYDPVKRVNGRKRHIVVDNLGFPMAIYITPANEGDRDGLAELASLLHNKFINLKKNLCRYGISGRKTD